uniref:GST C-terminal domain-containing protein n=1 Tax=Theropithecus gelada TaxID=9565 RepID=A0A8D2FFM5_THEGE
MHNLMQLAMICYIPEFKKLKPKYLEELPEKLTLYSQFLGKRPWFAGDEITFVDFLAYDILDLNCIFEPSCLDVFPNLKDFISRFEGLKKISYLPLHSLPPVWPCEDVLFPLHLLP